MNEVFDPTAIPPSPPDGSNFSKGVPLNLSANNDKPPTDAVKYLKTLDSAASFFTFQTFDDVEIPQPDGKKKKRGNRELIRTVHSSLEVAHSQLATSNQHGAGIFVAVNQTDGTGRKTKNITRIRCVWQDDDQGFKGDYPLRPTMEVMTSPGKFQRYWLSLPGEIMTPDQQKQIMATMVAKYGADNNAKDIARVLRVPGYKHNKNPSTSFIARLVGEIGPAYTTDQLMVAFSSDESHLQAEQSGSSHPDTISTATNLQSGPTSEEIEGALNSIPADDYADWIKVGQALKNELGESGFSYWDSWSQKSANYDQSEMKAKWATFDKNTGGVATIATIFRMCKQHGGDPSALAREHRGCSSGNAPRSIDEAAAVRIQDADIDTPKRLTILEGGGLPDIYDFGADEFVTAKDRKSVV